MILLNEEQRLGRKAYILMALKNSVPPLIITVIAIVLLIASRGIGDFIFVMCKLSGSGTQAVSDAIAYGVKYVVVIAFALAIVSLVMSLITTKLNYRNYTFTFEQFGMRLRRGRVRTTELTIPYRQMQDVSIERGFFHQLTGTSRVVINSAGHEEPATHFRPEEETNIILDPVDTTLAEEIRLLLQRKIGVQVVEGERESDRDALQQSAPQQPTSDIISARKMPPHMKAVFLDRDGTVNVGVPVYERVNSLDKVQLLPNTLEALTLLARTDYAVFFITNQAGLSEKLITEAKFREINNKVLELIAPSGIKILKTYICPHGENDNCDCRKPSPKLLLDAAKEFHINLGESWMIGDRPSDVMTGINAGTKTILVKTGVPTVISKEATITAPSLVEAVQYISSN